MFEKERKKIDAFDDEIVSLLKKRQEIVGKIKTKKNVLAIDNKDLLREKEIITRLKKIYDNELVEKVYEEIFSSAYE